MITKYNYKGVPDQYKVDQRGEPVRLRKKCDDERQAFDTRHGCTKFCAR